MNRKAFFFSKVVEDNRYRADPIYWIFLIKKKRIRSYLFEKTINDVNDKGFFARWNRRVLRKIPSHVSCIYTFTARRRKRKKGGPLESIFFHRTIFPKSWGTRYIIQFPGQGPRNLWVRFLPPLPIIPLVVGSTAISIDKNLIDTIKFHKVLSLSLSSSPKRIYIYIIRWEENSPGANDRNSRFPAVRRARGEERLVHKRGARDDALSDTISPRP